MHKFIRLSFFKAVGVFIVTSAVGIAVVAKAADVLAPFSGPRKVFDNGPSKGLSDRTNPNQLRSFSMEVLNDASRSENFAFSLVERGGDITATLQIKSTNQSANSQAYETAVSAAEFVDFWVRLRELEVEQLTNLSPSTENIGSTHSLAKIKTTASSRYRFKFQDGLEDYPNSFDVYAPEELQDTRYQALRELSEAFVLETFGEGAVQSPGTIVSR